MIPDWVDRLVTYSSAVRVTWNRRRIVVGCSNSWDARTAEARVDLQGQNAEAAFG